MEPNTIFTVIFNLQILHHAGSGRGTMGAPNP
jgi:hypothetical protein